jgi:hypothetical protein
MIERSRRIDNLSQEGTDRWMAKQSQTGRLVGLAVPGYPPGGQRPLAGGNSSFPNDVLAPTHIRGPFVSLQKRHGVNRKRPSLLTGRAGLRRPIGYAMAV